MKNFHWTKIKKLIFYLLVTLILIFQFQSSLAKDFRPQSSEVYYSYLGGENNESAYAIGIDSNKNIYIAGETNSDNFDVFVSHQTKTHFNQNCFILKISAINPAEDFLFEFAGSKRETCRELAIDSNNDIYLTGETQSDDLPVTTSQAFQGEWDVFIIKLSNDGILKYASYLGGKLTDYGHGLAVASPDKVYITGETWSLDFPTTNNAFMKECELFTACDGKKANAFLTHVDTSQTATFTSDYSTYLGGTNQDKAHDLAIDSNGHLHIVGETRSADFPLNNQLQDSINGTYDGFLVVINPNNPADEALLMSTYIGGSHNDYVFAVAVDSLGNSFLTGETRSDNFPVTDDAFSLKCADGLVLCNSEISTEQHSDGFITAIGHHPSPEIIYSSLLGGTGEDFGQDILIDGNTIVIAGTTWSNDFPVTDNADIINCEPVNNCKINSNGFVTRINQSMIGKQSLVYSTYIGGELADTVLTITSANESEYYLSGGTSSANLASVDAIDNVQRNGEAFLEKLIIRGAGQWLDKSATVSEQSKKKNVSVSTIDSSLIALLGYCLILRISTKYKCLKVQ